MPRATVLLSFVLLPARSAQVVPPPASRAAELALALSAAPEHLRAGASAYVLGPRGYELAHRGHNGFTCLVEREHPATVEPVCYDSVGSAAFVPVALARAAARAAGMAEDAIRAEIEAGFRSGRFRGPTGAGVAYMLATEQSVRDEATGEVVRYVPHLMFYAPNATARMLGLESPDLASPKGAPFLIYEGDPRAMVIVPVH